MAHNTEATGTNPALLQVLNVWNRIQANSPIYNFLLSDVDIYHAEEGTFSARLEVGPKHLNSKGGLHGVFSACVTDWAGGLAIASCGLESTGVSTNINVNYLSTATTGDWLEIRGYANKVGKSLAFTTITISKYHGSPIQFRDLIQIRATDTAIFFASGTKHMYFECLDSLGQRRFIHSAVLLLDSHMFWEIHGKSWIHYANILLVFARVVIDSVLRSVL